MNGYFENKVAAVTGAASGIGLGVTERLLSQGASAVFMGDLKEENLAKEADRLRNLYPGKVFPLLTDVTKLEQAQGLVQSAKAFDGHLDFLFNIAGVGMTVPTEHVTFEIWKFLVDVNLMGVVYGTYSAIPIMRKQGFGHIVNAGSITGCVPVPYQAVYAATKGAVIRMTESLQYELENEGLQFTVFCPGNVRTSIFVGRTDVPADSISVDETVDSIFEGMKKKSLTVIFPESYREIERIFRTDREEFEIRIRKVADERRENYRTKGTDF